MDVVCSVDAGVGVGVGVGIVAVGLWAEVGAGVATEVAVLPLTVVSTLTGILIVGACI